MLYALYFESLYSYYYAQEYVAMDAALFETSPVSFFSWRRRQNATIPMVTVAMLKFKHMPNVYVGVRDDVLYIVHVNVYDGFFWGDHFTILKDRRHSNLVDMHYTLQRESGPERIYCKIPNGSPLELENNSVTQESLDRILCQPSNKKLSDTYDTHMKHSLRYALTLAAASPHPVRIGGRVVKTKHESIRLEKLAQRYKFNNLFLVSVSKNSTHFFTLTLERRGKIILRTNFSSESPFSINLLSKIISQKLHVKK